MNCLTPTQLISYYAFPFQQMSVVILIDDKVIVIELRLTNINNIIISVKNHVDLDATIFRILRRKRRDGHTYTCDAKRVFNLFDMTITNVFERNPPPYCNFLKRLVLLPILIIFTRICFYKLQIKHTERIYQAV